MAKIFVALTLLALAAVCVSSNPVIHLDSDPITKEEAIEKGQPGTDTNTQGDCEFLVASCDEAVPGRQCERSYFEAYRRGTKYNIECQPSGGPTHTDDSSCADRTRVCNRELAFETRKKGQGNARCEGDYIICQSPIISSEK